MAVVLLAAVGLARGGVLYHRQHSDQLQQQIPQHLPQQNFLDDNVRLVKITRTVAVPVPYQVPVQVPLSHDVPLVLASTPQLVSVLPRIAIIPQHYLQHQQGYAPLQQQVQQVQQVPQQRQASKSDSKPAFSRQQHEQLHYGRQK